MTAPGRDARRRTALEAARHLLIERGVTGLSMRRLASASAMAVNTLYAMFGTRDGILEALVEDAVQARLGALRQAVPESASPVDRLEALVRASVRHAVQTPQLTRPMYRAAAERRALRRIPQGIARALFDRELRAAIDAGQLRADAHTALLAGLLIQLVHEASLAWALDEIDDGALEAQCLHALAVVLAAAAHPDSRALLEARLAAAGARLAASAEETSERA